MTDVRCPMCGKSNPADMDVCQFCQARLRPVWEDNPLNSASDGDASDIPDWLRELGGAVEEPAPDKTEATSWINSLRAEPGESQLAADLSEPGAPGSSQGLAAPDPLGASARPIDDILGEDRDWLSRLGFGDRTPGLDSEIPFESSRATIDASEDLSNWQRAEKDSRLPEPDWLRAGLAESGRQLPQADDELPVWLNQPTGDIPPIGDYVEGSEPVRRAEAELPDWLKASSTESPGPADALISALEPSPEEVTGDNELLELPRSSGSR